MARSSANESKRRTRREDTSRRVATSLEVATNLLFPAFAGRDDRCGINSLAVSLHLNDLAFLINQEGHAAGSFVLRVVDSVLFGHISAPVTQQGEVDSNLVRESG